MARIVECRTYGFRPGTVQAFLKRYQEKGYPVQRRILGEPVGYYYTEIGPLNQVVHMWAYASLAERTEKRQRLFADPAWRAYLQESAREDGLVSQETKILRRAPFSEAPESASSEPFRGAGG